jgi:hypothetical protein
MTLCVFRFLQCSPHYRLYITVGIRWLSEAEARPCHGAHKLVHFARKALRSFLVNSTVASQIAIVVR